MAVELRGVVKRVGADTHIHDTSLSLVKGEFNVLLGTTLSGKTTLMRLMAGLDHPTSGEVWFDGDNVTGLPVQQRSVAMVYQQFINYPNFTVFDNIASPLRVAGASAAEIRKRVEKIANLLQLGPMLHRIPGELSGGQQQRTALARALIKDAALVLLDEPLANLDYKLREELRQALPALFRDSGATVVYATSEPLEALMLGGHTATLHEGSITQYGPTPQVYREPNCLISARVFSDPPINSAPVDKRGSGFRFADGVAWRAPDRYSGLSDGSYVVGIRPHHLTVGKPPGETAALRGTVRIAEISGSESIIHVTVEGHHWVSQSHGVHALRVGQSIDLHLAVDHCLYFATDGERLAA